VQDGIGKKIEAAVEIFGQESAEIVV